jgi:hypothetical protein
MTEITQPGLFMETPEIIFRSMNDEVIRLDSDGFHYRGQFIADAGEAHRLMMEFLKQNTHPQSEPQEAPGEVGELVAFLKQESEELDYQFEHGPSQKLRRAATLLQQQQHLLGPACAELDAFMEQQAAPAPVPEGPTEDDMNDLADDLLGIVLPEGSGARLITRALELWGRPAIEPEGLTNADGIDEEAATVIPWLLEEAAHAADDDLSYAAGKLTLAAQLLGERRPATQPEPQGHRAIAKRAIESCLAQRDEVLAAFIAKYGFQPEDVIQVEQCQPDGTSTWRIERRPGPKPEELRDEDLEATARAAEIQPEPGEVEELVRRLRDWRSIPSLQERERIATLLQQLSTITTEDLKND